MDAASVRVLYVFCVCVLRRPQRSAAHGAGAKGHLVLRERPRLVRHDVRHLRRGDKEEKRALGIESSSQV